MAGPTVGTPLGRAPVIPLAVLGIGLYLAWFGVHYWGSDTKWPSDPVKDVLTGKGLPAPSGQTSAGEIASLVEEQAQAADTQTGVGATSTATSANGGGILSKSQIQSLWTANGGSAGTADIAAAIALAESAGQVLVTSTNTDGGTNVGLWQLDTKGKGAGYTVAQLQNPDTNARVAVFGSANGTNWTSWESYATGVYSQYL